MNIKKHKAKATTTTTPKYTNAFINQFIETSNVKFSPAGPGLKRADEESNLDVLLNKQA